MNSRILLVEDDEALVRSIVRNLSAREYKAQSAATVEEAIAALKEELPALLLLDIDLPDGSGWDVLRALRSSGGKDVPVIVLTALRANPRLVTELHCSNVLEKPFPMESLLRLVHAHLDEKGRATSLEDP